VKQDLNENVLTLLGKRGSEVNLFYVKNRTLLDKKDVGWNFPRVGKDTF